MDASTGLDVLVLGDVLARRDGEDLQLGGRRQRAVLAALVIATGEALSVDALVDCVWGDVGTPDNAVASLHTYISRLRRRLEPETEARARGGIIARAGAGYVLQLPDDAVDAWRFEAALRRSADLPAVEVETALDQALRSWRGPAFAEYADEPWARAEVVRLTELRALARERLLEARLDTGDPALLVPELERLVADDPLREERWRLLALALYRAHRQGDALAALRRARDTMAEELGLDPGPALQALEQAVLAQDTALAPVAGTARAAGPPVELHGAPVSGDDGPLTQPEPSVPSPTGGSDELAERDVELSSLRTAVAAVAGGGSGVVVIEGPAGLGKTRLLDATTEMATAAGLRLLCARGSLSERLYGFGAVRQLFEPLLLDPAAREQLLEGPAAGARHVFDVADDGPTGEFATLHGLYWLTVHLTRDRPAVLAIDDVQWCDSGSLRFLAYLVKRLEGLPLLVVATLRPGEQLPDETLLDELVLDPMTTVLRPCPLSRDAVRDLVTRRLGAAAASFVEACWSTTSGNPLLLRQLVRALESDQVTPDVTHTDTVRAVGSRAVSSLVTLRLRRMPPDATLVARAVAVLGRDADLPALAALTGLPEGATAAALDLLARAEILRDERPPGFVHPLVGDAVRDDVPAGERALLHDRAAEVLCARGVPVERVAPHLLAAPPRGDAASVALLREAARNAAARGATDTAVVLLRRALEEPPAGGDRLEVLVELGRAEVLVDGPAALPHLLDAYDRSEDHRARASLATTIVQTQVFTADRGAASAFARAAAADLPPELDDDRQGLVALERITGFMHALPPSTHRDGPALAPRGDGVGARRLAATLSFECVIAGDDRDRAVELARFALEGDHLLTVDDGLLWVVAANALLLADAPIGDFWERSMRRARATGSLIAVMSVNLWRGFTEWRRGELADALQSLADAAEQDRMWGGGGVGRAYNAAFTGGVLCDLGELAAAEDALVVGDDLPATGDGPRLLRQARARLRLLQGRHDEALAELDAVDAPVEVAPVWDPWRSLRGRALHGLGRTDDARALVAEEVELLRHWGAPSLLGPALRHLGRIEGEAGLPMLREAVEVLLASSATLELARARIDLGTLACVGDDEAVALLREGLRVANDRGARTLVASAAAGLRDRGHDTAPEDCPGHGPTAREQQVLDLTTRGLSVDEVADQLFLTPATVRRTVLAASGSQVAIGTLPDTAGRGTP